MPAPRWLKLLWSGTHFCATCGLAFAVCTLWLALALLLAVQTYIASNHELEVPGFLLRTLEQRLTAAGVRATFGRTSFDPTGRLLMEEVRLSLPAFAEPIIAARTIYVKLDPWALALGGFEPRELRVTGASVAVPAMLSRSGRTENILHDLDAVFVPGKHELTVAQFSARIAGIAVSAHGAVHLPAAPDPATSLPVADFLARNFPAICRQLSAAADQLTALDGPELHLELVPSESRLAIATVTLFARSLNVAGPVPVQLTELHLATRLPLLGDGPINARLELTGRDLQLPFGATAHGVRALVRGTLRPGQLRFEPLELELSAESLAAAGFSASAVAARLTPGPLPQLGAEIVALIMGAPLAIRGDADFKAQTARLRFDGAISPSVLGPLSERLHVDVRKYFDFAALDCTDGEVRLGPGWKFEKLSAGIAVRGIAAYHVMIDEGRAVIEFDGRHFRSPAAWARLGENFAFGSYEQDLSTLDYRFLLEGRLRPLRIGGWFGPWWPNFFAQLEFPAAPPEASVDVAGRWSEGRRSTVFVFADAAKPIIRGAAFDRVRALLFIRPAFYDGLELFATRGAGAGRGTFTYTTDPTTFAWRSLDFNLDSSLDPAVAEQLVGPPATALLAPFRFADSPALKLRGRLDGAAAPGGAHQNVSIEARSAGEFRFHDFPLENIALTATLHDDDIVIDNLRAGFAGGVATGHAKVWGQGTNRRVAFAYGAKAFSLGRAATLLQAYSARQKGAPPPVPGKFVQERTSVHVDLTVSAEGRYDDPFSYQGEGRAAVQGAELGEVPLLGLLSELFTFTALRFTSAQTTFKLEGAKLTFPDFKLRGSNSAIDAHGDFALDRRALDFKAKIFPFQESGNPLKSLVGAVLTPFSNVFEVKLTGTLDQPKWSLAIGPTNLLRSLTPDENPPAPSKSPAPGSPSPKP